jgi:Protein of unknown function (DUF3048) N-terminal domain/Protein of unknown function (DUF3048) C-terminal domain
MLHRSRVLPALLAVAFLASCGGSSDSAAPTTTMAPAPATTEAPATTVPATTEAPAATTTAEATTTTIAADPVMPLTGMPITDPLLAARPALVVKIDNHPQARPQFGLNAADIVFEENVEHLTRFAAVFQSQDAARVGPIRSGRTQDVLLLGSFNSPLFGWSGGNANVTRTINDSDLVSLNPTTTGGKGGFFRDKRGNEDSEHTLYSTTPAFYSFTRLYAPAPQQQFLYRADGEAFNASPATGVDLDMDGVRVKWMWDAGSASYLRFQGGKPHNDAENGQVNAANVVVLEVDYQPSPADARSPEAQTIGTGVVTVFTGGVMITGTWTRADRLVPFTLTDATGAPIKLTPGRTWVELARQGKSTPL